MEVLTHRFVDGSLSYAHSDFVGCLYYMDRFPVKSSDDCKSYLQSLCPQSFEDPRTYTCHEFLHKGLPNATSPRRNTTSEDMVFSDMQIDRFHEHNKCLESVRKTAESCLATLTQKCQQSSAIIIKTIRMRMSTVELLLRRFPDIRVLHVFRDPVPVVLSRYRNKLMSASSGGMVITEAVVLCSKIADDIRHRYALERKFNQNTFLSVYLDQFSVNPLEVLDAVYRHTLGIHRPTDASFWVTEVYKNGGLQFLPCANVSTFGNEEKEEFALEYCYDGFLQNLHKACLEYYTVVNSTSR